MVVDASAKKILFSHIPLIRDKSNVVNHAIAARRNNMKPVGISPYHNFCPNITIPGNTASFDPIWIIYHRPCVNVLMLL